MLLTRHEVKIKVTPQWNDSITAFISSTTKNNRTFNRVCLFVTTSFQK